MQLWKASIWIKIEKAKDTYLRKKMNKIKSQTMQSKHIDLVCKNTQTNQRKHILKIKHSA